MKDYLLRIWLSSNLSTRQGIYIPFHKVTFKGKTLLCFTDLLRSFSNQTY